MAGSFGYELDLNTLSPEEKEQVKEQICRFKEYGSLIHNGQYYRLSNPLRDPFGVWSFVADDQREVLVQGMIFRTEPNMLRRPVKLRGLSPEKIYCLRGSGESYRGRTLMEAGILLPKPWGDYFPVEMYFEVQ
jgi:alpha-galactosidase